MINITPPIVVKGLYSIRSRLQGQARKPAPSDYSALANPLEVPVQVEAYLLCRDKYLKTSDIVLDVGFGLGFGLQIMAAKVKNLIGVEVDQRAVERARRIFEGHPRVKKVMLYDGKHLRFRDKTFDAVTCVEIIEHVEDYKGLLLEMARVSRRLVFISTPNRRPENTLPDGSPKNYWHLREFTKDDLDTILNQITGIRYEQNFLDLSQDGQWRWHDTVSPDTRSLVPVLFVSDSGGWRS